ncbi:MAG: 6-bladed beta-propeller [Bacteroidales bacterium]|nr:6-bladed beta-propeller [Bacteroidales bacterium]
MNKASVLFILYTALFITMACHSDSEKDVPVIKVRFSGQGINTPFYMSQFIDSVQRITIPDDGVTIAQPSRLRYCRKQYYLVDAKDQTLYILNENGNVVQTICHRGRAENEYVSLADYDINEINGEISIYDESGNKMLVYAENGRFIRSYKLNATLEVYRDFVVLNNGDYLSFTPDFNHDPEGERGFWLTDSLGNPKRQLDKMDEQYRYVQYRLLGYFSKMSDGKIGFLGVEDKDVIYHITPEGSPYIAYKLDYERKMSKKTLTTQLTPQSAPSYAYMKYWYAETDNWIVISTISMNPAGHALIFYDKNADKEHLCVNDNDLVDDMKAEVFGATAAVDRLVGIHYPDNSTILNPEIVVAYLK